MVNPAIPTTIYAGDDSCPPAQDFECGGDFATSTDGGASFSTINVGDHDLYSLAIDPFTPTTIYAGTNVGAFKSTNGGAGWSAINSGLPVTIDSVGFPITDVVQTLAIDPSAPATIYAGTGAGVFKSINGGAT